VTEPIAPVEPTATPEPEHVATELDAYSPEIQAQVEAMTPPTFSNTEMLKLTAKTKGKQLLDWQIEGAKNIIPFAKMTALTANEMAKGIIWYLKIPYTEAKFVAKFGARKFNEVMDSQRKQMLDAWKLEEAKRLSQQGK